MNKICRDYIDLINKKFGDEIKSIIIYGSNIYNINSSDLDVCVILDECSEEMANNIINETLKFHKENNLKIDDEVPHINKLIYLTSEIEKTLKKPPYYKNGEAVIKDIKKTKRFLSSKEMKKRLLLNILTTDHITVGKPTTEYEKKAIKIMIDVICKYYNLKKPTVAQILEHLYENKYTGASGEMYLGYKTNRKEKEKYLLRVISEALND